MAVKKDFRCDKCNNVYEMEIPMEQKECNCPVCNIPMIRIYNNVSITRPSGDGRGFYGK